MASDYGMRGQAAARLLKGGKKGPPPEDMDMGMPHEEGGGAPMDLAALLGGGAPGEAPMEEPPMPTGGGEEPMPEEAAPMDLEGALAGVEGALEAEGLSPDAAEEIRTHLNAIRDIAAGGGMKQGPPMPEEAPGAEAGMAGPGAMGGGALGSEEPV